MPVDSNSKSKRSRRAPAHDAAEQREQEVRRSRGEISCAECFRLKLRCDKKIPCGSCVRRGCPTICPNGSLSGGQGTRFVLASTEQLHAKLGEMSERIRSLEDALEIMQAARSDETHPLLQEDLLAIKSGLEVLDHKASTEPDNSHVLDDFGTLTITARGAMRFLGRTGGTESLLTLITGEELVKETPQPAMRQPNYPDNSMAALLLKASNALPSEVLVLAEAQLPSMERGSSLIETYLDQASWFVRPISRAQLINELFTPIYKCKHARAAAGPNNNNNNNNMEDQTLNASYSIQDLALLFMVFAMGALADLTQPAYNDEAEIYHQVARYIVNMETVSDTPSLCMVQTLCLMGTYRVMANRATSMESVWATLSLASVLGAAIGLHRDPSKWKLDPKTVQRRRDLFWQIFCLEMWQSLASGRPTMFAADYRDCEFPIDEEAQLNNNGEVESSYWAWKYKFSRDILYEVNDVNCSVGPVKHTKVLELDQKIRSFPTSSHLRIAPDGPNWERDGSMVTMQRFMVAMNRDATLLYLHRSFFAKVMLDYADNPMRSPFASSFLASYRSALVVLKLTRDLFQACGHLMLRSWTVWKHSFSALIVVGSIVTRSPDSDLAPAALIELTLGTGIFEKAAIHGNRARQALSVLASLRTKAYDAFAKRRRGTSTTDLSRLFGKDSDWGDELATFGGGTRVLLPDKASGSNTTASDAQQRRRSKPPAAASSAASTSASASGSGSVPTQPSTSSKGKTVGTSPASGSSDSPAQSSNRSSQEPATPASQDSIAQGWTPISAPSLSSFDPPSVPASIPTPGMNPTSPDYIPASVLSTDLTSFDTTIPSTSTTATATTSPNNTSIFSASSSPAYTSYPYWNSGQDSGQAQITAATGSTLTDTLVDWEELFKGLQNPAEFFIAATNPRYSDAAQFFPSGGASGSGTQPGNIGGLGLGSSSGLPFDGTIDMNGNPVAQATYPAFPTAEGLEDEDWNRLMFDSATVVNYQQQATPANRDGDAMSVDPSAMQQMNLF